MPLSLYRDVVLWYDRAMHHRSDWTRSQVWAIHYFLLHISSILETALGAMCEGLWYSHGPKIGSLIIREHSQILWCLTPNNSVSKSSRMLFDYQADNLNMACSRATIISVQKHVLPKYLNTKYVSWPWTGLSTHLLVLNYETPIWLWQHTSLYQCTRPKTKTIDMFPIG